MKTIKQGLALLLAAMLIIPPLPAAAEESFNSSASVNSTQEVNPVTTGETSGRSVSVNETDKEVGESDQDSNGTEESSKDADGTGENNMDADGTDESGKDADGTGENNMDADGNGESDNGANENKDADGTKDTDENGNTSNEANKGENGNNTANKEAAELKEEKSGTSVVSIGTPIVQFNTGNHVWTIADPSVSGNEISDAYFEEDGSFTINIPEANPFFPYEVQFTCEGEVTSEWFMTPDDSVEVGGHTFYVSAYFDNTVVTQMSLEVAGDTVIVYPEKKEFTNDGDGAMSASLLPLEEINLRVDLSAYTPVELTMVSIDSIFTGENQLADTDKVMWVYGYQDNYTISSSGDKLDLTVGSYSYFTLEMIVGDDDQLAMDNVRYNVNVIRTDPTDWLTVDAYVQDENGNRKKISVPVTRYVEYGSSSNTQEFLQITFSGNHMGEAEEAYISLGVNSSVFESVGYDSIKVYDGIRTNVKFAMEGKDITEQIWSVDMSQKNAGYLIKKDNYVLPGITIVAFDVNGNVVGYLPLVLSPDSINYDIRPDYFLYQKHGETQTNVLYKQDISDTEDGSKELILTLYKGYPANGMYYYGFDYYGSSSYVYQLYHNELVTAVYEGTYNTISEAVAAGATEIKSSLTGSNGYGADYSKGIDFTFFIGADDDINQEVHHYNCKTVEGTVEKSSGSVSEPTEPTEPTEPILNSGIEITFGELVDREGNEIVSYRVDTNDDSYGEKNYITFLVDEGVDISDIAFKFSFYRYTSEGAKLYAAGKSQEEVSGQNYHNYQNGPIQFTVTSEDGKNSKNYWINVIQGSGDTGQLWINSLSEVESETKTENGIVYSKREVMLDSYHNNVHDIFVANKGLASIPELSVELTSDVIELDEYWTLKGNYELSGLTDVDTTKTDLDLKNIAKVRIKAKEDTESKEVSGTLTFKSQGKTLMVLTLTGVIGDPSIVTKEIPQAVKYVPYGTVIQNNNKYSWNEVSYSYHSGKLPEGMEVRENGEIYGVPTEAGEFTFEVLMRNSSSGGYYFPSDRKTFTLIVVENTDTNVDAATDTGYDLTQRVQDLYLDNADAGADGSQTLVSQGIYDEFRTIYLDGVELTENKDYTYESGSTRITILNQTLAEVGVGTHTLGIEFRVDGTDVLKRAAQNYDVTAKEDINNESSDDDNNNQNSDSSGDNDHSGNNDSSDNSSSYDDSSDNSSSYDDSSNSGSNTGTGSNAGTANNGIGGNNTGATVTTTAGTATIITYTVQSGDTLWKIAAKFYGSGTQWTRILADNAGTISNPDRIYAGQVIIINMAQENTTAATTTTEGESTYTVQAGDTLWKISQKVYGRGWQWRRIYNANTNVISAPERIYVGQVLTIP